MAETSRLLDDPGAYRSMARGMSPYGDGLGRDAGSSRSWAITWSMPDRFDWLSDSGAIHVALTAAPVPNRIIGAAPSPLDGERAAIESISRRIAFALDRWPQERMRFVPPEPVSQLFVPLPFTSFSILSQIRFPCVRSVETRAHAEFAPTRPAESASLPTDSGTRHRALDFLPHASPRVAPFPLKNLVLIRSPLPQPEILENSNILFLMDPVAFKVLVAASSPHNASKRSWAS